MNSKNLPDVALERVDHDNQSLDFVGMSGISIPIKVILDERSNVPQIVNCKVEVGVNLNTSAKGIHMSRIYSTLNDYLSHKLVTFEVFENVLKYILETHKDLSDHVRLNLAFEYQVLRPSLISENQGWRTYPLEITACLSKQELTIELGIEIVYSSTCPCSAALSRQLIQNKFNHDFSVDTQLSAKEVIEWLGKEENICATPHSQRSTAVVKLQFEDTNGVSLSIFSDLINDIEQTLGTPVQAMVKRADEQEFARLNASNLMFCEDSGRKLKTMLQNYNKVNIANHYVRVEHHESLHEHDVVAEFYG